MLGRGTFGYVQLVESVRTGKKFAMKVLPNTLADLADRHVVEREVLIQAGMQHTNIVSFVTFATTAQIHIIIALTACGTEQYKAPEMWVHEEQTPGVDMWSLGCIFEALTKRLTFPQAKTSDMIAAIDSPQRVAQRNLNRMKFFVDSFKLTDSILPSF
ncbi:hypothetical protein CRE_08421 [Caenorhabditis remanei]|uniref:Protein kinase domain-containing protein n=1 Tax=Caenorhabditis remanei TaxID=31234 RepID=E3MPN0_CAERE|nr:hypothetical protein CRE_08421 [Caenorhabditis remanei]